MLNVHRNKPAPTVKDLSDALRSLPPGTVVAGLSVLYEPDVLHPDGSAEGHMEYTITLRTPESGVKSPSGDRFRP